VDGGREADPRRLAQGPGRGCVGAYWQRMPTASG
jgi:hypothetical protein